MKPAPVFYCSVPGALTPADRTVDLPGIHTPTHTAVEHATEDTSGSLWRLLKNFDTTEAGSSHLSCQKNIPADNFKINIVIYISTVIILSVMPRRYEIHGRVFGKGTNPRAALRKTPIMPQSCTCCRFSPAQAILT